MSSVSSNHSKNYFSILEGEREQLPFRDRKNGKDQEVKVIASPPRSIAKSVSVASLHSVQSVEGSESDTSVSASGTSVRSEQVGANRKMSKTKLRKSISQPGLPTTAAGAQAHQNWHKAAVKLKAMFALSSSTDAAKDSASSSTVDQPKKRKKQRDRK
eukprot:4432849-Pyramimonas_sp.AAC.2